MSRRVLVVSRGYLSFSGTSGSICKWLAASSRRRSERSSRVSSDICDPHEYELCKAHKNAAHNCHDVDVRSINLTHVALKYSSLPIDCADRAQNMRNTLHLWCSEL